MNNLYLIGQFALIAGISNRMLRHYDKLGLITPSYIDPANGYRYYDDGQLPVLQTIGGLQHYGFTLGEIKELMTTDLDKAHFKALLKDKEILLRQSIDDATGHLLNIQRTITLLSDTTTLPGLNNKVDLTQLHLERSHPMALNQPETSLLLTLKSTIAKLPNTLVFDEQVDDYLQSDNTTLKHFITMDLDGFSAVNDLYGFDVGDLVIYKAANLMIDIFQTLIDEDKCSVCRYGGDEMVFFLTDVTLEEVKAKINQVLGIIRDYEWSSLGCMKQMTTSCGVYTFTSCMNHHEPRHNSAKAFMEVKRTGKDNAIYRTQP